MVTIEIQMKFFKRNRAKKILGLVLVAAILLNVGIYGSIIWKYYQDVVSIVPEDQVDPTVKDVKIAQEEQKDDEVFNVLLVGTDSRDPNSDMGRSDSMMLVSFNQSEQKSTVVSFMRDSLVEIGGVKVYITEEEAEYYRQNGMPDIQSGDVTLTGSQALAHARNRTLGSDFERTRRQRSVMYGIYRQIMAEKDASAILPLINYCMNHVKTNMSVTEIYDLAKQVLAIDNLRMQQASMPTEGAYQPVTYEGMDVLEIDIEANKKYLNELLY